MLRNSPPCSAWEWRSPCRLRRLPLRCRSTSLRRTRFYNLLFCDEMARFKPRPGRAPASWQAALFGADTAPDAVKNIAAAETAESRVRLLAFNWLREHEQPMPPRTLLGVIVEVPVRGGVDVLAAYLDGEVRYINHDGSTGLFSGKWKSRRGGCRQGSGCFGGGSRQPGRPLGQQAPAADSGPVASHIALVGWPLFPAGAGRRHDERADDRTDLSKGHRIAGPCCEDDGQG